MATVHHAVAAPNRFAVLVYALSNRFQLKSVETGDGYRALYDSLVAQHAIQVQHQPDVNLQREGQPILRWNGLGYAPAEKYPGAGGH